MQNQMQIDEKKMKELVGLAQKRADEIFRLILDGENSLTAQLVKAYRAGHESDKALEVFAAIANIGIEAASAYKAAIAQPAPKVGGKSRVTL